MPTHEAELTEPVDLCAPRGRRLSPDARGWSRTPLHRANLRGGWGRTKRWDYWAVLAQDLAISVVYADVDYLGIVGVWWADLSTGDHGGRERTVPFARGMSLPDVPGSRTLRYSHPQLEVEIRPDRDRVALKARWLERDDRHGRLDAEVVLPDGHESVNVVVPWSDKRFQFTSKHQARPAHGELIVGDDHRRFGDEGGPSGGQDAWGVLDVGRGRWPYSTVWNWAGGAGRSADGRHTVGLQLGARWTQGTGATENGIIIDGRVHKLGDEHEWSYDWDAPLKPWHVRSADGSLDLELTPRFDRHARTNALMLATEVHQVFGRWRGRVPGPDGERIEVDQLLGFAEESRSRW